MKTLQLAILCTLMAGYTATFAQSVSPEKTSSSVAELTGNTDLPAFVIEREIPDAGLLTSAQLTEISQVSCDALGKLGPRIQWLHSYVTDDKVYCVYRAENVELLEKHAAMGGFPINRISPVATRISPATARGEK